MFNCNSSPYKTTLSNDNPNPKDYPKEFGIEEWMTNRALRATELFGQYKSISKETFYKIKFDTKYSVDSQVYHLVQHLINAPIEAFKEEDKELAKESIELIKKWDYDTNIDNIYATLPMMSVYDYIIRDWRYKDRASPIKEDINVLYNNMIKCALFLKKKIPKIRSTMGRNAPYDQRPL